MAKLLLSSGQVSVIFSVAIGTVDLSTSLCDRELTSRSIFIYPRPVLIRLRPSTTLRPLATGRYQASPPQTAARIETYRSANIRREMGKTNGCETRSRRDS